MIDMDEHVPVIFYDGDCLLCNRSIQFVLRHEKGPFLTFATLDSKAGREVQGLLSEDLRGMETVILYSKGNIYTEGDVTIQVSRYLRAPWSFLRWAKLVPRFLRNMIYRYIARNRIQWFGTTEESSCQIMPEHRHRFLLD